jgi:hypothetical protein
MSECVRGTGNPTAKGHLRKNIVRPGEGTPRQRATTILAHRLAWIEENGPIPKGMIVHHLCGNPPCINLDHLNLMVHADHTRLHRSWVECPVCSGTEKAPDGRCLACKKTYQREYWQKNHDRLRAYGTAWMREHRRKLKEGI